MLYKMRLVYGIDLSDRSLNKITETCGDIRYIFENAVEVSIEQTVDFVPTEELIKAYAAVIKHNYEKANGLIVEKIRFLRYDYLLPVENASANAPPADTTGDTDAAPQNSERKD